MKQMKNWQLLLLLFSGLWWGCGQAESDASVGNAVPEQYSMVVTESGGADPANTRFEVSSDSLRIVRQFKNISSGNALPANRALTDSLFIDVLQSEPETIHSEDLNYKPVYVPGGDNFELSTPTRHISIENSGLKKVVDEDSERYLKLCNLVKDFVVQQFESEMIRVDLVVEYLENSLIKRAEVQLNKMPLLNWEGEENAPTNGYNALLPGTYQLQAIVNVNGKTRVYDQPIDIPQAVRLEMQVFPDRIEFNPVF